MTLPLRQLFDQYYDARSEAVNGPGIGLNGRLMRPGEPAGDQLTPDIQLRLVPN
jgi:hypothetical protein